MELRTKVALSLALTLMFASTATAQWYMHGGYEPDTPYDTRDWIWQDAPGSATDRVYFGVISGYNAAVISFGKPTINPNVGLLRTHVETPTLEVQHGFLGVWVDCNGDGYMGLAESALREYSSALLGNSARCPPHTGPTTSWLPGQYNYNGWVSEYIPIVDAAINFDARTYVDPAARVWGDFDEPDKRPIERNCPTTSFPRGGLSTSGGILNYFDCRMDIYGPANLAFGAIGDPAALSFADEDDGNSGRLGQFWVYGPHDSQNAGVKTVDCSEAPIVSVQTVEIRTPRPQVGDLSRMSVGGQLNQTNEEWVDDCNPTNDDGHEFTEFGIFGVEDAEFSSVNPNNKTKANWNFRVAGAQRGGTPFLVGPLSGKAGAPQDAGTGIGGTHWLSDSLWTKFGPRTVRYDLDSGQVGLARAYWLSFYATVGTATKDSFRLPSGSSGTYGAFACEGHTSGIRQGWNCDVNLWYRNLDGTYPQNAPLANLAKPGWKYQMRDVDCYDGRIGAAGVGVGAAYYGEEPCP